MKTRMILLVMGILFSTWMLHADETVTVTATSSDISENLDLKTVATLFGQAKDLEQFEQLLNDPDSAFSNLDLNGDGDVDYLRVVETADGNRHLVVIQAILAKDIYQDVASIYVDKDDKEQVTIQVVGDEYVYGANYIIEPVYIYRPLIYDWFWGPSWVCWHSPYYWNYWPGWWHPYHCIAHHLYWDHCYWYHHHYPICTYRTGHHHHPHYHAMHERVRKNDYGARHPERSFASRNASRGMVNARGLEARRIEARTTSRVANASTRSTTTRVSTTTDRTFGSTAVRTASTATRSRANGNASTQSRTATQTRTTTAPSRSTTTTTRSSATPSRSTTTTTRTTATPVRTTTTSTPVRSSSTSVTRSSSTTPVRSSTSTTRSSSSSIRSTSSGTMRSSGGYSSGGSMRTSGSSSSRPSSGGSRTR